jgi:hypothetical protein
MLKIAIPYFDDVSLDRWMMSTAAAAEAGGVRLCPPELALAEALQKFHIASCQASRSKQSLLKLCILGPYLEKPVVTYDIVSYNVLICTVL